ncbi:aspartic peptidase domain-containing protein [Boeremia exigua]|uniref:aspartic peptidase domain-containing protein n=1 Tax=Boeremia exigua TaxID=749465 RepID=UPI001E8CBD73|nr:aspartic peptidase domain-containing protein [Boeremia exigua]KAH6629762.1 aspartic peptidase domain-containing protein [Boeremia exigua]
MLHSRLVSLLTCAGLASSMTFPIRRRQNSVYSLTSTEFGAIFEIEIKINNQSFYVVPDTGSSDLWVAVDTFQCVDPSTNTEIPQADCHFGSTYTVPNSTVYVQNQTFGVQYGSGIATGKVAYADVTVNGITVKGQKIGLVDRTNDIGDGLGSGILGLGFPPLTSAHPGTEVDNTSLVSDRVVYDPVFVSMYNQGLVEPWYSFALLRPLRNSSTSPGGWFGLGELPPVAHSNDWAVKPIEVTEALPDVLTGGQRLISLMTLTVDGVVVKNNSMALPSGPSSPFQAVVDTGNPMNLLPMDVAESINTAFNPVGVFNQESNRYIVDCNATTPDVGIILDGRTFWLKSPDDLIYYDTSGTCHSSIAPTAEGLGIALNFLGDAFLSNVVAVFDFGKQEMRFAATTFNDSGAPPPFEGSAVVPDASSFWPAALALAVALWHL